MAYSGGIRSAAELISPAAELISSASETHQALDTGKSANQMSADPITSTVAASVNVTFKLAEFILSIKSASKEMDTFAKLIQRIRKDRTEVCTERRRTYPVLLASPDKLGWVNDAVIDTDTAFELIGGIVEGARIAGIEGHKVSLTDRFKWVMAHKEEMTTNHVLLNGCHRSLLAVLTYLHGLDTNGKSDNTSRLDKSGDNLLTPPTYLESCEPSLQSPMALRRKISQGKQIDHLGVPEAGKQIGRAMK